MTAIEVTAAPPRRLAWQLASASDIVVETPRVKSVMLNVRGWRGIGRASTLISGSPPRTDIRRSAATRSPQRRMASRSP
jgi:hypothetical protein